MSRKLKTRKKCFCQSVQCAITKNEDLSKDKRPVDCWSDWELELL